VLTLTVIAALAAAGPSITPESPDSAIEEIIVTSRYRAEKLSDVPDSITAFTAEDVERYRMERINRVAAVMARPYSCSSL
jgi:iron complex outermembrane receptor protein